MPENDNSGVVMLIFSMIMFMIFIFTENMKFLPIVLITALFGALI